jgi:hypothetical protein
MKDNLTLAILENKVFEIVFVVVGTVASLAIFGAAVKAFGAAVGVEIN